MTARQEIAASRNFNPADVRSGSRMYENLLTASFLRRSLRKDDAGSANRAAPTTNEEGTSKTVRVKTRIASFHTAWVKSGGSGLVRRLSGLASNADILLRCREP